MDQTAARNRRDLILILIPAIVFYAFLLTSVSGVPFLDDYSVLDYSLRYKLLHGVAQHLMQVLMTQHNEYRVIIANAIIAVQYAALGHCNLVLLCIIGNLFMIPMPYALYLIWKEKNDRAPLTYFVPASWLLFQLQYASCLNFAMSSYQTLTVVLFGLLSIYLATVNRAWHFIGSMVCLTLAICGSGNGFFLIPVVCVLFWQTRRYKDIVIWLLVSVGICLVYFHGFNFQSSQTHADHSLLSSVKHLSPAFALAFIGNLASVRNHVPAIIFGSVLVALFLWATVDRLYQKRPATYYSLMFFFITAAAVSGLRSEMGLSFALGSRYRISCTIVVILMYFYLLDKFRALKLSRFMRLTCATTFCSGVFLFTCVSDYGGGKFLRTKREKLDDSMLRWERHEPPKERRFIDSDLTSNSEVSGQFEVNVPTLTEAIREGVYTPPPLPEGWPH